MIICPNCGWENPAKQIFCISCGQRLDLGFEDIDQSFANEIQNELEAKTEAEVQQFLMAGIFLLIVTVLFRVYVASGPAEPVAVPLVQSPHMSVAEQETQAINPLPVLPIPQD